MKQRPRIYYTESQKALMWERWRRGESLQQIAQLFDRNHSSMQRTPCSLSFRRRADLHGRAAIAHEGRQSRPEQDAPRQRINGGRERSREPRLRGEIPRVDCRGRRRSPGIGAGRGANAG